MSAHAEGGRRIEGDWYDGLVPANVVIEDGAWVESAYYFVRHRSTLPEAIRIARGCGAYAATVFDLGPRGRVTVGENTMLNGVRFVCDAEISIGDHCIFSWNTVVMDSYRTGAALETRAEELNEASLRRDVSESPRLPARPVRVGRNVWVGFDSIILPGVTIGEGSIVGARSVVAEDLPPYCIAAGNPAKIIRHLSQDGAS